MNATPRVWDGSPLMFEVAGRWSVIALSPHLGFRRNDFGSRLAAETYLALALPPPKPKSQRKGKAK